MSFWFKTTRYLLPVMAFGAASYMAVRFDGTALWHGLDTVSSASAAGRDYDLTQLRVASDVVKLIRDKYVDPKRVKPREMLLSALNFIQRDVAQVIVVHEENAPTLKVRIDTQEKEFRVDTVVGPWDLTARLQEIFSFIQQNLKGTEVDLREVEYAACNGMLHTLDPHSVLLSPEAASDMSTSTKGQFGGLGIVISIRDQELTVMSPMPGTPAGRAGLKRLDRITRINNESTLNMGLQEALEHLRGTPGSKVTIWVRRDGENGWKESKPFELSREVIKVKSVESKALDGNVGYVRLKQFQQTTTAELDAALAELKKNGELKGLVLDLRGNPGGLLDQAARVVDRFVAEGPIVATVGNPRDGRDEKVAHKQGTEPNYPIALLVSGNSASASEIVAGALKNHDRAVVVGETTFGKGSVQLVFDEMPDKAALKLTIAQYLTEPGDISIQGTGVTPDIELDPMTADLLEMDLNVDSGGVRERDLSRSLSNARIREGQKPQEVVRYNFAEKDRQEFRDRGGELDDVFAMDFPIRFGRDLVAHLTPSTRPEQLKAAKDFVGQVRAAELAKVSQDLQAFGIDWSDAPGAPEPNAAAKPADVEVKIETDRPGNTVSAGDAIQLKISVTNKGKEPLYRLFATTKSDNGLFDKKELVIGKLEPGKTKIVTAPLGYCEIQGKKAGSTAVLPKDAPRVCAIPKDVSTRSDFVTVSFDEARSRVPAPALTQITMRALERPVFAYGYQMVDNRGGNGDGRVQKGENFTMYLTVKNVGKGRSYETQVNLKNLSGDSVLLHEGRFDVSNLSPGESRKLAFTFDVQPKIEVNEAKFEISVTDRDLRESVGEKIRLPISLPAALTAASGTVKAKGGDVFVLESPDATGRVFGKLVGSAEVMGKAGDFTKVKLDATRFAFVRSADVEPGAAAGPVVFDDVMGHMPPNFEVAIPDVATRGNSIHVKGILSDGNRILDGYVFVGSKKIFYQSNRNGADPKKMGFQTEVPLRPGVNVITVVARESPDTTGRRTFVVRRDGPNGEYLPTPKNDDELSENAGADE